ncbi:MAG TPA: hypothetical protein VF945_08310 [Polyangia bacterium]
MKRAGEALLPKYERMRELRAARIGDDAAARAELRAFAAAWPGALKELDTLTTEEIERRARACASGDGEPWMAWSVRYHELVRAALAIRRGEPPVAGGDGALVDEAFVRAVKRPRHGRINVVVFAELAREFDLPARDIWDALFPPRGRAPRDYRR